MTTEEKEHLLHKVAALSAFVFALSILPVAQALIGEGQVASTKTAESGQVAGVSTDTDITQAVVPTPTPTLSRAQCLSELELKRTQLASFDNGKKQEILRKYMPTIDAYQAALPAITGTAAEIAKEKDSLHTLIAEQQKEMTTDQVQLAAAVEASQKEFESTPCPAE